MKLNKSEIKILKLIKIGGGHIPKAKNGRYKLNIQKAMTRLVSKKLVVVNEENNVSISDLDKVDLLIDKYS